jgi:hypothetical protein
MFGLAALDTLVVGLVSGLDDKLEEDKKEQNYFAGFSDAAYILALAILDIILVVDKIGVKFPSEMVLDAHSTEITSPYLHLETKQGPLAAAVAEATTNKVITLALVNPAVDALQKADDALQLAKDALSASHEGDIILDAFLNIKNTANGKISNKATIGGISNEAIAGGITNKAQAGGITNTADLENITSTAIAGNITNKAGAKLTNEGTAEITNTGAVNNLTGTTSLNLKSDGVVSVKGLSIKMEATGIVGVEATTNLEIKSKGVATIDGAVIKVG